MARFRKKPVVIEATQWFKNGDHPEDGPCDREGEVVRRFPRAGVSWRSGLSRMRQSVSWAWMD